MNSLTGIERGPLNKGFVPYSTIDRVDVATLSNEDIKKNAEDLKSNTKYEVILQDLLLTGKAMNNSRGCQLELLAVELFLEASIAIQTDFLLQLQKAETIFKRFVSALTISYSHHEFEEFEKLDSSGLSQTKLEIEKKYVEILSKWVHN